MQPSKTYFVELIKGESEGLSPVDAGLHRSTGSPVFSDQAVAPVAKTSETPDCCKEMAAKVDDLQKQVDEEKLAKSFAEVKVTHLEEENKSLSESLGEVRSQAASMTEKIGTDLPRAPDYARARSAAASIRAILQGRRARLAKFNEEVIEKVESMFSEFSENQEQETVILEDHMEVMTSEIETREKQGEELKKNLSETKSELETSKREVVNSENARTELEGRLSTTANELEATKDERDAVKGQLDTTESELRSVQSDRDTIKDELNITKDQLNTTEDELNTTKDELNTTKDELRAVKDECDAVKHELGSTKDERDIVKDELSAAKLETAAIEKEKIEIAMRNASVIAYKNGELNKLRKSLKATEEKAAAENKLVVSQLATTKAELASLRKSLKVKQEKTEENQLVVSQLATTKAELEASKKEAEQHKQALIQITAMKNELKASKDSFDALQEEKIAMSMSHSLLQAKRLGEITKLKKALKAKDAEAEESQHIADQLTAAKAELETSKIEAEQLKQALAHTIVPENDELHTIKMELEVAKQELSSAQIQIELHQGNAFVAHMTSNRFSQSNTNLQAKCNSLEMTQEKASEALLEAQHEIVKNRTDASMAKEELETEKGCSARLLEEVEGLRAKVTDLRSELEVTQLELGAFKAPKPAAPATPAARPVARPAFAAPAADKMAAWKNAHAFVRADDEKTRRENEAKAAATPATMPEFNTTWTPKGAAAKANKVDAVRAVLNGIEADLAAKDKSVAVLKEALAEEKSAGAERKRELAAAQLALESTQGSLREARAAVATAEAGRAASVVCQDCVRLECKLRRMQKTADEALAQADAMHFKCMASWNRLHDVEANASSGSGTPESEGSTSGESDGSIELEIVGGDGPAPVDTPSHSRRHEGAFAGRSLALHMPGLVRK